MPSWQVALQTYTTGLVGSTRLAVSVMIARPYAAGSGG